MIGYAIIAGFALDRPARIVIARRPEDAEAISEIATDAFSILAMTVLYEV